MKITITITALLSAMGASGAALTADAAHQEMKRFCGAEGQGCWQVKRAAADLAAVLTSRDTSAADTPDLVARHISHQPGGAAYKAKRAVEALAVRVASTQEDPEAFFNALELEDAFFPDSPAHQDDDADDAGTDELTKRQNGCRYRGQSCWKRDESSGRLVEARDGLAAHEVAELARRADLAKRQNGCKYRGQSCWKRDAETGRELEVRDVHPFPEDVVVKRQNGCTYRGQPCWKNKRDLTGLVAEDLEKRQNGCRHRGQSCWKRDTDLLEARQNGCQYRGQSCWKRDVLVQDHASDKRWCHEAGNACAVAKRAATAVLEAAAVQKRQNGCRYRGQSCWKRDEAGLLEVRQNGCRYRGQSCWKRDLESGKEVLARDVGIAARCNGPAGECTKAARDLEAVEIAAREVLASLE
ncbi:hypothetical protein RB595_009153 [Gaeumannomyces hyphopodioides]